MELIIEIVSRSNKVLELHHVSGDTISIGRAYDNDVVLQEEHVCPHHAKLEMVEGKLLLTDNHSVNGIKDKLNRAKAQITEVVSGDVFILGKVFIRVLRPEHPVPATKKLNFIEDFARSCNHWYWALGTMLVYYFILLANSYHATYQEVIWSKLTVNAVYATLGMCALPLFIALMSRVFKKDVKFFTIFTFCFGLAVAWLTITDFGEILWFNWGDSIALYIGAELIDYAILLLFIAGSFYLASTMSLPRIVVVSSILVVSIASLFYINERGDDKVLLMPNLHGKVLASKWLIATPKSADQVKLDNQSLFIKAVEEAQRRNLEAEQD